MVSPVCGLRPMRALRCTFFSRPRPGTTKRPFFLVSLTAVSVKCSRKVAAVLLFVPTFSAKWRTSWVLVMPEAMSPPLIEVQFSCDFRILHYRSCGKTAPNPHFRRLFFTPGPESRDKSRVLRRRLPRGPILAFSSAVSSGYRVGSHPVVQFLDQTAQPSSLS